MGMEHAKKWIRRHFSRHHMIGIHRCRLLLGESHQNPETTSDVFITPNLVRVRVYEIDNNGVQQATYHYMSAHDYLTLIGAGLFRDGGK